MDPLLKLLDDPDPEVSGCVRSRICDLGRSAIPQLVEQVLTLSDSNRRKLLLTRLEEVNSDLCREEIRRLYDDNPSDFDLGEAAFLLASYFDVTFTRRRWDEFICTSVSLFAADDSEDKTALERVTIFNYLFFHRLHFVIEDDSGAVPLSEVIAHRHGCPQTVALLWFVLAAEAELPVLPLCFKGGYVPVWMENGREILRINLLDNGNPVIDDTPFPAELKPLRALPLYWLKSVSSGDDLPGSAELY